MITLKNLRARCALHGSCQHVVQKKKLTQQLARSRLAQLWIGAADGEHDFDSICGSHTCGCRTHVRQIGRRSTALEGTLGIESNPSRGDCNYLFFLAELWWYNTFLLKPNSSLLQAIMRCRDTDRKDEHVKELGAHEIKFTTKGIAHYVVAMQSKKSFVL